jgi:serine/threonine-protein kinase HipA
VPRRRLVRELTVAMNGRAVGVLRRPTSGVLAFQYDPGWLGDPGATPISLRLPLSPDPYTGAVVANYFDNLLPDNQEIRERMQRALDSESTRPFDLLARAGRDCVGALQLLESRDLPNVRRVEAKRVSDSEIARILRDHRAQPLGMSHDDEFRISIAGAQEKTAFLWHRGAWHRPRGATPTSHIFKLPIGVIEAHGIDLTNSVENEWLCLQLAARFGLPVPDAKLETFEDVRVLVIERFDRKWSPDKKWLMRLPQEDLCQAFGLPPGRKYEASGGPGIADVMELLLQSLRPQEDRRAFFKACVVYWLLAAIDGHAKNFSLMLQAGGRCMLAPFYDVLSAYPFASRGRIRSKDVKLAMAVAGKSRHYAWKDIQRRHWLTTAAKCRFPSAEAEAVLEECFDRIETAVDEVVESLPRGFPPKVADAVLTGLVAMRKTS